MRSRVSRLFAVVVLGGSLVGALAPTALADGRCSGVFGTELFINASYGTPSSTFCGSAGRITEYASLGGIDNMTSSFQLFNRPAVGYSKVRMFTGANFGGSQMDFYESRATMPSGWNNTVSSLMLVP